MFDLCLTQQKIKKPHIAVRLIITSGEDRIRTDDLLTASQAL